MNEILHSTKCIVIKEHKLHSTMKLSVLIKGEI